MQAFLLFCRYILSSRSLSFRSSNQVVGCRFLQVVSRARFAGFAGYLGSIEKGSSLVFGFWKEQNGVFLFGLPGIIDNKGACCSGS